MAMVGVQDCFGRSGKPADVLAAYGLTAAHILSSAEALFSTKKA
jgi:transketolase C-terminal domain/subunit